MDVRASMSARPPVRRLCTAKSISVACVVEMSSLKRSSTNLERIFGEKLPDNIEQILEKSG